MANWYISSVGWNAVAAWAASTVYALGQYVRQSAAVTVGNERVFKCTTAGTSGASEPAWNLTGGATTADGTVVWTEVTGKESEQLAGNWRAPAARLSNIIGNSNHFVAGDTVFVSQDHAEIQSTALVAAASFALATSTNQFIPVICVNRAGGSSLPPVSADLATTATLSSTAVAQNAIVIGGQNNNYYFYGITFKSGNSTATASDIQIRNGNGANPSLIELENCELHLNNSGATGKIEIGEAVGTTPTNQTGFRWINTKCRFGHTGQLIELHNAGANFFWERTPGAILGTVPNTLFSVPGAYGEAILNGIDLSAITVGPICSGLWSWVLSLINCRIAAGVAANNTGGDTSFYPVSARGYVSVENTDDSTNNRNYRFEIYPGGGRVFSEATLVRTNGASDGVTPLSWNIKSHPTAASNNAPTRGTPMKIPRPIARRYNTTGGALTATLYFIANAAAALKNTEVWMDVEALTNSGSPLSTITSGRADLLPSTAGAAYTADTSAWDGSVAARQNSTAYTLGQVFKVASAAAGVVWFCTTAGTTAASEPGGYSGATDGASVTDGTAVFRAGYRQRMTASFTPQKAGIVKATLYVGLADARLYVDPKLDIA
jgi:hypothetical protein